MFGVSTKFEAKGAVRITWVDLHGVGTSKIVNSSFIALAAIPALSRLLALGHEGIAAMKAHIAAHGGSTKSLEAVEAAMQLPFNFVAFYYAAFFFAVAAVLFHFFCPKILKLAPSFGAYQTGGFSFVELKHWYHDMVPSPEGRHARDAQKITAFIESIVGRDQLRGDEYAESKKVSAGGKLMGAFWNDLPGEQKRAPHAYQLALVEAETKHSVVRRLTAFFYGLGFLAFIIVAFVNLAAVASETLRLAK